MDGFGGTFGLGHIPVISDGLDGFTSSPSNGSLSAPATGSRVGKWFTNFAGGLLDIASNTAGQAANIVSTAWLDRLATRNGINTPGTPTEARLDESPPGNASSVPSAGVLGGQISPQYIVLGAVGLVGFVMLARK